MNVSKDVSDPPRKGARQSSRIALAASASPATSTLDQGLPAVSTPKVDVDRWKQFTEIGLLPKPVTQKAQKLVVSTYRVLGLGILTLVVLVLVGYITVTTFYFFNRSWVAPVVVSASDEEVVGLQSQLAAQLNARASLVGEIEQAERAIVAEQSFHLQFVKAIKKDLEGRKVALGRARQLSHAAAATRHEIRSTNGDYSESTFARMNQDYDAGMIDRQAMLAGKFQLAQISTANLTLAERQAEFDQRAAELAIETQSLDAILANKSESAALSYEILTIARDYEASKLALARELSNRERLKGSIERQDQIIAGIKQSAYLRAIDDGATVALVPYGNLGNVKKGASIYKCRLEMVLCRQVGKVLEVLPGEVEMRDPSRDVVRRGRMIEMELTERGAAEQTVLFADGPPLGF